MANTTYQPKGAEIKRDWHLLDAQDQILGRLATQVASFLIGKHKKTFSPHLDSGDYVVVINAEGVRVTGKKETDKMYYSHSGFPGGLKTTAYRDLKEKSSTKVIEFAVYNMLPKNRLRKDRMARLKVFSGAEHKYSDKLKVTSDKK